MLMRQLILGTSKERTARISIASRLGSPVPETVDMRGEGFVDFANDYVWTTDRLVTKRMATERKARGGTSVRIISPVLHTLFNRVAGYEVFYRGGARWRKTRWRWRGPSGAIDAPKNSWHPLFMFDAVQAFEGDNLWDCSADTIDGKSVTRADLTLKKELLDGATSSNLSHVETSRGQDKRVGGMPEREAIAAVLWFDQNLQICRMSFEAVPDHDDGSALWLITEFRDFGVQFEAPKVDPSMNELSVGLVQGNGLSRA